MIMNSKTEQFLKDLLHKEALAADTDEVSKECLSIFSELFGKGKDFQNLHQEVLFLWGDGWSYPHLFVPYGGGVEL